MRRLSAAVLLLLALQCALADEEFVLKDIKVEGLQRITLGTTFNYLPLKVGETLTRDSAANAIRELFKTGFFEDVWFSRDGDVLVIHVMERPSISSIKIFGNQEISTEDLSEALKKVGLAEGRVFNRSLLDQIEQELHRQYFNLGKYGVNIDTIITELERNRVDVQLDIAEGEAARIKQIKIVGAHAYKEEDLLDRIELSMPTFFSGISGSDKYSKQQLVGDQETLRSFYLDRGYINFNIDSTQVSISPDKNHVFITINISEGDQFVLKDVKLSGEMVVPKEELEGLIDLRPGEIFSRRRVVETVNAITDRLGIDGYAFTNVNSIPQVDNEAKTVALNFFIDPGSRVYVRRINVLGNTKTEDEVIRRELRQMEGGWISTPLINRSKVRLQRLGFFEEVKVDTPAVPGTTDQVDVNFQVTEGSTGTFTAGIGYGQENGFLFNTSVTLNNFLGSGKRVGVEVQKDDTNEIYSFNYNNPYYTADGISRGFSLSSRKTDQDRSRLADFNADTISAKVNFGFPMTEYTSLRLGIGADKTKLNVNESSAPQYYVQWVEENGDEFEYYTSTISFAYDTRNRAIFPDHGVLSQISAEVALPSGDLEYYKASYRHNWYIELKRHTTLMLGGEAAYGEGYGDTAELPFFENYYTGGTRSVRGFRGNTIGPKDSMNDDAVGGNAKFVGRAELFFASPFGDEPSRNFRMTTFIDAGQVFTSVDNTSIRKDDRLRISYGVGAVWITPVGALTFSFAWPYVSYEGDETDVFGFNIGAPF